MIGSASKNTIERPCLFLGYIYAKLFIMKYFALSEFLNRTGVSASTAYRAEQRGIITPARTRGGHRRYSQEDVVKLLGLQHQNPEKKCVVYCRVDDAKQKKELDDQRQNMIRFATARGYSYEVWEETGSGTDFNRPEFMQLVNGIIDGRVGTVIVACKDTLTCCGFALVQNLATEYGTQIIIANLSDKSGGIV